MKILLSTTLFLLFFALLSLFGQKVVAIEPSIPLVNAPSTTYSASVARTMLPLREPLPSIPPGCSNLALDSYPLVGGQIIVIDPGTLCPEDEQFYENDTIVTILAIPNMYYNFLEWQDDATGTNITTTVTMNEDKSVVGVFDTPLECHLLNATVLPNGAAGDIVPVTEYNCEEDSYDGWLEGTLVQLNAVANFGYDFVNWSGGGSGSDNPYFHLFVDGDQNITANFVANGCHAIAVHPNPVAGGSYEYTPAKNCADGAGWLDGTTITLDALPNTGDGYTFNSWEGYGFGVDPVTMTMTVSNPASIDIDLNFDTPADCYTLNVNPSPTTGGQAIASPEQNCVGGWVDGTVLALYAIPNPGYSFESWDGPVTDTSITPTGVVMDADKNVTANFTFTGNDIWIIKSGTYVVQEGGIITYTLSVINNGSNLATNLLVDDQLPANVSYIGYSSSLGSCAATGQGVICYIGVLPPGPSSTEIEIYVTADTAGIIVNTASVTATEFDPNPGNNQDSAATVIKLPIDLEVEKMAPITAVQGRPFNYDLSVINHGPGIATNVILQDVLPSTVQHVSTSSPSCNIDQNQEIACFLGNMNSGDAFSTTITVIPLEAGSGDGLDIINTAVVFASEGEDITDNNSDSATTTIIPNIIYLPFITTSQ